MRRTSALPVAIGVGLLAVAAIAGTITHTSTGDWANGTRTNIDNSGNRLDLLTRTNLVDDWYRYPWNDFDWEVQAEKDDAAVFSDGDRCLRDTDNATIDGPTATVNSHDFRTGTRTENISGTQYVASIPTATPIPLPVGLDVVDQVRFLTLGSHIAQTNYTVTFHYSDLTSASVVVPIKLDTVTGAGRSASGAGYNVANAGVFTRNTTVTWDADTSGATDCAGNGGDDVIVDNPQPAKSVTDIEFTYVDYVDPTSTTGWLGGPVAASIVTTQAEIEAVYDFFGEYVAPVSTAQAVNAGANAIWYQLTWTATIPSGSEIFLHVTCGNDNNPTNGTLDPAELDPEFTVALSTVTSPYTIPVVNRCSGRYLTYRVEIFDEFSDTPFLDAVSFVYDPDADADGYGDDGNATTNDCNDNDAAIRPGAIEIIGDGVDQNCDGAETCYDDADNDGSRSTNTRASTDFDCNDNFEAVTSDPIDCNDADAGRFVGNTEVVGDGIDQNCDLHDDCYRDIDRDAHGITTVVTALGATCLTTNQEATVNDDCDDNNANRYPGNTEVVGDGVDQNCNNIELCYQDTDNDNARHETLTVQSITDQDCADANEGANTDPIDCDDNNAGVKPASVGGVEVAGNNLDDDCNGTATCYTDADNDGSRLTTTFTTVPGDTDCNDAFEGETADPIDCLDSDANVKPASLGGVEIVGNNLDDDCSSTADCYTDGDNDGARTAVVDPGGANNDTDCNDANEGLSGDPIDCDDTNATIKPTSLGGVELVGDNVDENCDDRVLCYADADNDGARHTSNTVLTAVNDENCTDPFEGLTGDPIDCNDNDALIKPGVAEIVGDQVDQNCDTSETCYVDSDNDGNRTTATVVSTDLDCIDPGEELATAPIDCADNDNQRFIGNTETVGNEKDNDCNNQEICWADADLDLTRHATNTIVSADQDCIDPGERPTTALTDCDDTDATAFPGNTETVGNQNDNDCNGQELCWPDADNDNYRLNTGSVVSTDEDCLDSGEDPTSAGIDCDDTRALTNPGASDTCGNGIDDDCDGVGDHSTTGPLGYLDDDADGLTWAEEQALGTDDCDSDFDNDGLSDFDEDRYTNTDPLDSDSDNDGVNDGTEVGPVPTNPINTDGTDNHDALDPDDDNDGVLSILEDQNGDGNPRNDDNDGDGVRNMWDTDDDDDGILTFNEDVNNNGNRLDDHSDGDGLPDFYDNDDDNDGILTALENLNGNGSWTDDNTDASTGDTLPNYRDADDDGDSVPTFNENLNGNGSWTDDNTDASTGDVTPNYLDNEDDGDGILTINEQADGPNTDVDLDLTPNYLDLDSDGDGYTDAEEGRINTDGDSPVVYDYLDTDSDNDTVLDLNELREDLDGTGGVNRVDNDDDGDGIPTAQEVADPNGGDGDGIANYRDLDSDGDGWSDAYEWTVLRAGRLDDDADGRNNYVDDDSDGDTLLDDNELGTEASPTDSDGDGIQNRLDKDDDGDTVNTIDEIGDPTPGSHADQDGDGTVNYLDTDDDDDGEETITEDPNGNVNPADDDTDGDGLKNFLDDDDDGDGIPTEIENSMWSRNADGVAPDNHLDTDSDNDGWLDEDEAPVGVLVNTDGDTGPNYRPDFVDTDSEDDTVPDNLEGSSVDLRDSDGDGTLDRLDLDDDNDQIPTAEECSNSCGDGQNWNDNWDGDALVDYRDPDDDNDGVPTLLEDADGSGDPRDDNTDEFSLRAADATPDYLDDDDDGDGLDTIDEDPNGDAIPANDDTDGDGSPDHRDDDDDGDSLFTYNETELRDFGVGTDDPRDYDFDGDGRPNYLDDDDDQDFIETYCEVLAGVDWLLVDNDGDTLLDGEEWYNFLLDDPTIPLSEAQDFNFGLTGTDCGFPWDRDSDGVINALDSDDDDDCLATGVDEVGTDLDCLPGTAVPGGDGIPDYLDRDADNDGIPDGGGTCGGEGLLDGDGDFVPDFLDCDASGCAGDSDVDGILNCDEQLLCEGYGHGADCIVDPDIDDDGVIDGVEIGSSLATPKDTDGDSIPDFLDTDDDGDAISSQRENQMDCGPGLPLRVDFNTTNLYWTFWCLDGFGVRHDYDFGGNDLSNYPNTDAPTGGALPRNPDTVPDFLDTDDDGDGNPTLAEGEGDSDNDGVPNWLDPYDFDGPDADPDGDGLLTVVEEALGTNPYNDDSDHDGLTDDLEVGDPSDPTDFDGDGIIDALDTDDDDDGVPTVVEGSADVDGDGVPNHHDTDSDGDGKLDGDEGGDTDDDCDGVWNSIDPDDTDGPCMQDSGADERDAYVRQGCQCDAAAGGPGAGTVLGLGLVLVAAARRRRR